MIIDLNCSYMIVQRKIAADDLIAGHFADGACDPVNVEGTVRQAVMDNVTSAAVDLFDAAQKQVFKETVWSIPITAVFVLIVELSVLNHCRLYIYILLCSCIIRQLMVSLSLDISIFFNLLQVCIIIDLIFRPKCAVYS